ncbi:MULTISPECIES: GspH/FimT family pseudopilin [unclassified Photobacterium]|uniref:GspH/FimT family pseudopilin n=1 Tax=unclassified Photobacterium TaxID=2628852 RepID=UPI001EDFCDD0|nr:MULTISPECIES: GspH/FimT family pseudopilin [unclassified Photobacterium]MCG3865805.1 GspH/FimT family pseudopilin [Photobacterium sp. Ph6]MCG3877280.1 GspH/FimT family pseudopilin [Photobacterium sp. Ph5]
MKQELRGLFIAAKSEAVLREDDVYLHTVNITEHYQQNNTWCIAASRSDNMTTCNQDNDTVFMVSGEQLKGVTIRRDKK